MEHRAHNDGALPYLEVVRGITRFPRRELRSERFLIGSGASCHLRLGGNVPPICCVIHREGTSLWIDALLPDPELFVNDRRVEGAYLNDGDRVRIGDFEFVVRIPAGPSHAATVPDNAPVDTHVRPEEHEGFAPDHLGSLTVDELIDRLEADLQLLRQERQRRQDGAATLLEAIRRIRAASEAAPPSNEGGADMEDELPGSSAGGEVDAERAEERHRDSARPDKSRRDRDARGTAVDSGISTSVDEDRSITPAVLPADSAPAERGGTPAEDIDIDAAADDDRAASETPGRLARLAAELRQIALLIEAAEPTRRDPADRSSHVRSDGRIPPATTVDRYVAARLAVLADDLERLGTQLARGRRRRVA
ncbi:MAG: hypothetical protein D6725_16075 [Planctomycetota bacterium]|nr:MAG: hypothetical protein D6725_16075 [Planctomycetota bacterium]